MTPVSESVNENRHKPVQFLCKGDSRTTSTQTGVGICAILRAVPDNDVGVLPDLKIGTRLHLYIDQDKVRFVDHDKEIATVSASAIAEISYGEDVHRRIGAAIGLAVVSFGIGRHVGD